jgi:hypothetical protein
MNKSLIQQRTEAIERLTDELARLIGEAEGSLLTGLTRSFINRLEISNGVITNTAGNKALVYEISRIYERFMATHVPRIANHIFGSVDEMLNFNKKYFTGFATKEKLASVTRSLRKDVLDMLGFDKDGLLVKGGYVESMLTDVTVKTKILQQARRAVITKQSVSTYTKNVQQFVTGDGQGKNGAFRDFYKESAMDVIAQADRIASNTYADDLKLEFAIYEGNVMKTTRDFCRTHVGKVYHKSEIARFNPPTAVPPNYNPFVDLGGYNCRHHLNWISVELALQMRPDVKKFVK